jgi:NAD(P)-dependent dehydrogenase (short-subunit alcohol dehydrogenase family)
MKRLEGRVAVVTGAASGIGRATAERLADEGAVVVITDLQDAAGEEAVAAIAGRGASATFLHHDVTSEEGWRVVV